MWRNCKAQLASDDTAKKMHRPLRQSAGVAAIERLVVKLRVCTQKNKGERGRENVSPPPPQKKAWLKSKNVDGHFALAWRL